MRALWRRAAACFALVTVTLPLRAGQDWVDLRSPRVAAPGAFRTSLNVDYSVQDAWDLGNSSVALTGPAGEPKLQRLISLRWDLGWQWSPVWGVKLGIPYNYSEISDYPTSDTAPTFRLNDPGLQRADSLGDVSLELRRAWGPEEGAWGGALWLALQAPTGIGPFEAPHPLAATGGGRWQIQPGVVLDWSHESLSFLVQASAPVQVGRTDTVSSQAALSYGPEGPVFSAGGTQWLGPRYGTDVALGAGWDWYADADSRQTIGLELRGWQLSALELGGAAAPGTLQQEVSLIPQLQAQFGSFRVLAAWSMPALYGYNTPISYAGGTHLRADYGF